MRKLTRAVVLIVTVLIASVVSAPAAHASTNPYNPYVLCGAGFTVRVSEPVVRFGDASPAATLYLLYNATSNLFCAVAIKFRFVGVATETMAGVGGISGTIVTNSGPRYYYAGPVWQPPGFGTPGCVAYGASLTDPAGNSYHHETANPAIGWSRYCL